MRYLVIGEFKEVREVDVEASSLEEAQEIVSDSLFELEWETIEDEMIDFSVTLVEEDQ
mgnify:CR=1 FL=1